MKHIIFFTKSTKKYFTYYVFIFCFYISLIFQSTKVLGQKNDTTDHKIKYDLKGSYNKNTNNQNFILNNELGYSYKINHLEFNANTKWIYGFNSEKLVNNDFTGIVDGNYFFDSLKMFNAWILGSYLTSYSLKVFNEYQTGAGLAYKILDNKKNKHFFLRISDGIIFESSNFLNTDGTTNAYNTIRNSLRVQAKIYFMNNKVALEHTSFWQPSLDIKNDYNFRSSTELKISISSNMAFGTKYEYNYISRTQRENTIINYGISIQKDF
jgi:hypothetical protein